MLLEVGNLVRRVAPGLLSDDDVTVVRIHTTRPLFAVFQGHADSPACVVHMGSRQELETTHNVLRRLLAKRPALVPASLVCEPWIDGVYINIRSGLKGRPWFALPDRIRGLTEWYELAERGAQAVNLLHETIRESPEWVEKVTPADEMRRLVARGRKICVPFVTGVWERLDAAVNELEALGEMSWWAQHGDMCLNNLIFGPEVVSVIDFEEFGLTRVPLNDEMGLAFSAHDLSGGDADTFAIFFARCVRGTLCRYPMLRGAAHGLLLHHLLFRLIQCSGRPTRQTEWYKLIERITRAAWYPDEFVIRET
jgi:hypothetical protein